MRGTTLAAAESLQEFEDVRVRIYPVLALRAHVDAEAGVYSEVYLFDVVSEVSSERTDAIALELEGNIVLVTLRLPDERSCLSHRLSLSTPLA